MKTLHTRLVGTVFLSLTLLACGGHKAPEQPAVLSIRERVQTINAITQKRLDILLPRLMEETAIDMWIIVCNEDNLDPVLPTMMPYDTWPPITQILVLSKIRDENRVERLNISRTNMRGLHTNAWDTRAWDLENKESQWDCLARIVKERNPQVIGINVSDTIWAADGLTVSLKRQLEDSLGPVYTSRFRSAESLATLWLQTLLDEEIELYEHVSFVARSLIAETFSRQAITPGVTTTEELLYYYMQRVANLGLQPYAWPWFRIRWRDSDVEAKFGKDDTVIRPGDLLQCDAGIYYLRYYTDHAEWAYILKPGEKDAPEGFRSLLAEGNRLQDIFVREFQTGLTGNVILSRVLENAVKAGIPNPKIYSHSIGYFLHEPGPLIGLPWEQKDTGARGEVILVPNSLYTAELSVAGQVSKADNRMLTMALEQVIAYTADGVRFLGGRQTCFHLVR